MNFRTDQWDTWSQSSAEARGTASFPEAWLTGDLPPCDKAKCEFPLATRSARIVLSEPTKCWNQTQFNRAQLYIEGTKWETNPWDTKTAAAPLFCAPRPKTRKAVTTNKAKRATSLALARSKKTFWNYKTPRYRLRCDRRARYRFTCKASWAIGDLSFGASGTVRSIPTRSEFPRAKVKLRILRFDYYCALMNRPNCAERFRVSARVWP